MKRALTIVAIAVWAACLCVAQSAGSCRLYVADQENWASNVGFYIDLEATTKSDGLCHLDSLTMYVAIADGKNWRYPSFVPAGGWQYGHAYQVVVTIAPNITTTVVDGVTVQSSGAFAPLNAAMLVNEIPSWASSPAVFTVLQGDLTITNSSGTASYISPTANLPADVLALSGSIAGSVTFTASGSDTQVIHTSFTLQPAPASNQSTALIDQYGQSAQSIWTGKVASDADLLADDAAEQTWLAANPPPQNIDAWGGLTNAGWSVTGTGFYTTTKRNGYWWLISPAGNPLFYTGLCGPPALSWDVTPITGREWEFASLPPTSAPGWMSNPWVAGDSTQYYSFVTGNLIRKFGASWQALSRARTAQRLPSWGFTGLGKWSDTVGTLPNLPVIYVDAPLLATGHIDPFDPGVQQAFKSNLTTQIAPRANDSTILGWSYTNEIQGIVLATEAQAILQLAATVPAKQQMIQYGVTQLYAGNVAQAAAAWGVTATSISQLYATSPVPPATDLEKMREFYENAVQSFVYQAFKQVDPNHLYFGFWIVPGWWADPSDWTIAAQNSDVLGFDWYAMELESGILPGLLAQVDKPTLIGEFSFPPTYNLARGFGVYAAANAADDAAAGAAYQAWLSAAATEPTVVGTMWFQYRDEPISGRGPCPTGQPDTLVCGEHYAFGAADETDRPKYALIQQMRAGNLSVGPQRLALTNPQTPLSSLTANPNPIPGALGGLVGTTTVSWSAPQAGSVELHVGSPTGILFAAGGANGSAQTGEWVTEGMTFYLQDTTAGKPLAAANTLAILVVDVVQQAAQSSFLANPNPIPVAAGAPIGATELEWSAPGAETVEIHVGSPAGTLFSAGGPTGSAPTGLWVSDGMTFYLQDTSGGKLLLPANTISTLVVHLQSQTVLAAIPNPIPVAKGGVGTTTVSWNAPSGDLVQLRIGAPNGVLFAAGVSTGSAMTGPWVSDGMTFYLQDVTGGKPLTAANTLATLVVHLE